MKADGMKSSIKQASSFYCSGIPKGKNPLAGFGAEPQLILQIIFERF